jgi:hypothetical protein
VISQPSERLQEQYSRTATDVDFGAFLRKHGITTDEEIAELVEADGRARLRLNLPVPLSRYLKSVPSLAELPVSLDAAIDMTLRWAREQGRPQSTTVEALCTEHPRLARAIRDAATLDDAIWSTRSINHAVATRTHRPHPGDLGPATSAGPRYRLIERIGSGSQGDVYRAEDRTLSDSGHTALVAVKVLSSVRGDAFARERLTEEASKARRVVHPNVVRVLDRGEAPGGEDFIVYELVEGGDLAATIDGRLPMDPDAAVSLVAKVASGVHAAHAAGLVHCDLKPGNIILAADGEPKVADFGIAVRLATDGVAKSEGGRRLGNIAFASPELFRGEAGAASIASDVYALGGILYYLLSGVLPNGDREEAIARAHDPTAPTEPTRLRARVPSMDADLDRIVARALSCEPSQRHSSAAALAEDLRSWLQHEPIAWTRPSPWRIVSLFVRRRPKTTAALVALAFSTAAGGSFAMHYWAQAQRRAAAMIEEQVRNEQRRQDVLTGATAAYRQIQGNMIGRLGSQTLTQSLMLEWVMWDVGLTDPAKFPVFWEERIEAARNIVEAGRAAGGLPTFETLMWESACCFWLVSTGKCAESRPILDRNRADWRRIIPETDPWHAHLETLEHCAVVVEGLSAGGSISPRQREELERAVAQLEQVDALFVAGSQGTGLHRLSLITLHKVHASDEFRNDDKLKAMDQRFRMVGMSPLVDPRLMPKKPRPD